MLLSAVLGLALGSASAAPTREAVAALRDLRTTGFAKVPLAALLSPKQEEALRTFLQTRQRADRNSENLLIHIPGAGWRHGAPEGLAVAQTLASSLHQGLKEALPGESLELGDVHARRCRDLVPLANIAHIDDDYLAATLFDGAPGTDVLLIEDGSVRVISSQPGEVTVFSGSLREAITGAPATIHRAHPLPVARRDGLLIDYHPRGISLVPPAAHQELMRGRERFAIDWLEKHR